MTRSFSYPINNTVFHKAMNIASGFGYLQGGNYYISPTVKAENQIASISAIMNNDVTIQQVRDAFFSREPKCISKEWAIIKSRIDAYKYISDPLNSVVSPVEVCLKINALLSQDETPYSNIRQAYAQNYRIRQIEEIFSGLEIIHPFIRAAEVFQRYLGLKLSTDSNSETGLFLTLFILFCEEPALSGYPLQALIDKTIQKKSAGFDLLVAAMLDELYLISYPIAVEIEKQRQNPKDAALSRQLQRLLAVMADAVPMSSRELMAKLKFSDLSTFRKNYLSKFLLQGLVIRCLPDHPTSRNQTYKISPKGIEVMSKSKI